MRFKILPVFAFGLILFSACAPTSAQQSFNATPPPTFSAPIYTNTPQVSSTPLPSITPLATSMLTPTTVETPIPTTTPLPTLAGTQSPFTPSTASDPPPADERGEAPLSAVTGWSCDDFPCADDISGWLQRIQVPPGFRVEHVGRFPGQPMQITYGRDGRLYATVLENGTRNGAVYVMDADGTSARYSGDFVSPLGLAFQPGTDVLYVSARMTLEQGGGVWRVTPGNPPELVIGDLPCCFRAIDNQPDGMIFGQDGYLYLGVGSLSDTTANPPRSARAWAEIRLYEASILRIDPLTATVETYAQGIRNPFDLAITSAGQLYATDNGLLSGEGGDRVLQVAQGGHYGWPYWGGRGCTNCPIQPNAVRIAPDLLAFPAFTLPRGIVAYTGAQFPSNFFDNLFVALWNGVEGGQRIVRIEPQRAAEEGYLPQAFVTGLIRPIDVTVAPDGSLVVADYVYGNVWRVVYER